MHSIVGRLAVLLLCVIASEVGAQPPPQPPVPIDKLPTVARGELPAPTNPVSGTTLKIFDQVAATQLGNMLSLMTKAIANCDRPAFSGQVLAWLNVVTRMGRDADATDPGANRNLDFRAKANEDNKVLFRFMTAPEFPDIRLGCAPLPVARPDLRGEVLPGFTFDNKEGLGFPEKNVRDTPIAVYDQEFANFVGNLMGALREAATTCNGFAYDFGLTALKQLLEARIGKTEAGDGRDRVARGQAAYDVALIETYLRENWIRYPQPCTPEPRPR